MPGIYEELDRLLENPTLNSVFQTLSATTMIARHIMNRHAGALRLTTSTKFKLHLNKVTRIFEIQRK
ncbi:hypothetical protein T492DRAFT_905813 [Pavlovales sp. CCMP2436]|nr:hypothetical protein T492DRAFT_905813 [Pavlovales sp. CCMP2436]